MNPDSVDILGLFARPEFLVTYTIGVVQFLKRMLTRWPVPPMAFVVGEGLWVAAWWSGAFKTTIDPHGAGFAEWALVLVVGLFQVVLAAMGGAWGIENLDKITKRAGNGVSSAVTGGDA